jgi:4-amino-4-deoxy-L-arabinose transferase-like glycosyltransferase
MSVTNGSSLEQGTPARSAVPRRWSSACSLLLLAAATSLCLAPFLNKAFHMDDPLFVWTARHIADHPLDPYGFRVVWYSTETPLAEVTKNPPLASYYAALAGGLLGWSEVALHLAFLLAAIAAVLGTYGLARRFTEFPLLAAGLTLFTPGFLVSASTVMCDVLMLALWVLAMLLWLEGFDSRKHVWLLASSLLIGACALTKYFGLALLPLLAAYSWSRQRRWSWALAYFTIPVAVLAAYQYWTHALYGRGLLSDAAAYASLHDRGHGLPPLARSVVALAFLGGSVVPALGFAPLLWRRGWIFSGLALGGGVLLAAELGRLSFEAPAASQNWHRISLEIGVLALGGASALGLAAACAFSKTRGETCVLWLWIFGTFLFAAFVNWTVNARSVLPLVPAVAILLVRRLSAEQGASRRRLFLRASVPAVLSGALSLWALAADAELANAGRTAAAALQEEARDAGGPVYFEGHWGFQYYMQQAGAEPADIRKTPFRAGDMLLIPENATNSFGPPPGFRLAGRVREFPLRSRLATMSQPLGAGFYASVWGPLPFALGAVPPERYLVARLAPAQSRY